jgi:hypothetical protein
MSGKFTIIAVNDNNLSDHPQAICFINPKHPAWKPKAEWLKKRFSEGMVIKLLYLEGEKRPAGFIEYVPGDQCWRAVSAPGYLVIHCIWISAVKNKKKGYGSLLLQECLNDAVAGGYAGVAAMVSEGSFMADKSLFLKNDFRISASEKPHNLVVRKLRGDAPDPVFNAWRSQLDRYQGLHILYSNQCPWVCRFIMEVAEKLSERRIAVTVRELLTPEEARQAPSPYAVFNLIHNGRLLADHYISETRLMNILKKEKLLGM